MRPFILVAMGALLAVAIPGVAFGGSSTNRVGRLAMAGRPTAETGARPAEDVTAADAHAWLARYREAWTGRDTDALVALGAVQSDKQEALRRALAGYKRLDVAVTNDVVSVEPGRALVSFDRADTDETGHTLRHPRYSVVLERRNGGLVSTQRQMATNR